MNFLKTLYRFRYEVLLIGLIQHIFAGLLVSDLDFYATTLWPITMILLGISTLGIFEGRGRSERLLLYGLLALVIILPLMSSFFDEERNFMQVVNVSYIAYFGLLFYEVMRYLIRPGRVNTSVLFASICGFFLILEIFVFSIQYMFYNDPSCLADVDQSSPAGAFIDIVYFCVMVLTSIGFGDIVPATHHTKLFTSFMGIVAQIYNVVLVGILISRFSSRLSRPLSDDD